jgi:hypothetical protein
MPDRDIVERSLYKAWRQPYRLMKGGHSPGIVSEGLLKALTAHLRENGGVPVNLVASLAIQSQVGDAKTLAEVSRAIERDFGQQKEVKLLARAAQRNMAKVEAKQALPGPLSIVQEYLGVILKHHFFSKVSPRLVDSRGCFANVQQVREFEAGILSIAEPQLVNLARRLVSDPTASSLRAPISRRRRLTTAELLNAPLMSGLLKP